MSYALLFVGFVAAVSGIFDVYLYLTGGEKATISSALRHAAFAHPGIPFAAGLLMGHLWL